MAPRARGEHLFASWPGRLSTNAQRSQPAVRAAIKHLAPEDRARLISWLLLYYRDDGMMYSPQITRRRQRVALDGIEYWLVRVPRRT
jgi:hypothetical protein